MHLISMTNSSTLFHQYHCSVSTSYRTTAVQDKCRETDCVEILFVNIFQKHV